MPRHRADVLFRAKEGVSEPTIEVQQAGGDVEILPDNLTSSSREAPRSSKQRK